MSDRRTHRGPHPEDKALFSKSEEPKLQEAIADYSWLLSKDYARPSALKVVGDHFSLTARQRVAVGRCACSDPERLRRKAHEVPTSEIRGKYLAIDGYNLLTTIEAALSGGVILKARDGAYRDMASMHGSYRKVVETEPALNLIGETLEKLGPSRCVWWLDRPVSNSGRLKSLIQQKAKSRGWPWEVELIADPDPKLSQSLDIVVTSDSAILDRATGWTNLTETILKGLPNLWLVHAVKM